ncbi:glycosyltransferase family 2 protein [Vagococcus lutrae]|uniref:glycosyltransferase family 2 protein n=1 Tax=Vagococcus lutrae TaxID=81947 RepID=UPI0014446D88|nr:glycosyltransferase family 2 protein [Vagococcus lutrae]NKZ28111.1 glycosyltransferase family 2 protein [Vagococcus lutrae]
MIHIDAITKQKKNKQVKITGWAFFKDEPKTLHISVGEESAIKELKMTQQYRSDVNQVHHLSMENEAGFEIDFLNPKNLSQVTLKFSDQKETAAYVVELDKVGYEDEWQPKMKQTLHKIRKGWHYLRKNGVKSTWRRLHLNRTPNTEEFQQWIRDFENIDIEEMKKEMATWDYQPTISVLVPVYNVEEKWLRKCVDSVINQVYPNWELCLSDDASTMPHVKEVLSQYEALDNRIKVAYREENGHICHATNTALELATGEFISLLDNDDELAIHALFEVVKTLNQNPELDMIYSDENKIDVQGNRLEPTFKPDWSPDMLLGTNYINHLGTYRRSIMNDIKGFRPGYEGAQDYDMVLRFTEKTTGERIAHIPKILYHWRMVPTSTAVNQGAKNYAFEAGRLALEDAMKRRGIDANVTHGSGNGLYDVHYTIKQEEFVSIIIPTKNGYEDTKRCLQSIIDKTTYHSYEILLADNGSTDPKMFELYADMKEKLGNRFNQLSIDIPFNYSRINNIAAKEAKGKYLLFLNNDTEVISPDWIETMVSFAQFEENGAIGAKLYYPNQTIQHAGVILGLGGAAGHGHHTFPRGDFGYFGRLEVNNNYLAVTAACVMIKATDFWEVDGFDETLTVAFNDVDLCLKLVDIGKKNIWAHRVELLHYESQTRGHEDTPEKLARFKKETEMMEARWSHYIENDPYYNPNLTRVRGDFSLRKKADN